MEMYVTASIPEGSSMLTLMGVAVGSAAITVTATDPAGEIRHADLCGNRDAGHARRADHGRWQPCRHVTTDPDIRHRLTSPGRTVRKRGVAHGDTVRLELWTGRPGKDRDQPGQRAHEFHGNDARYLYRSGGLDRFCRRIPVRSTTPSQSASNWVMFGTLARAHPGGRTPKLGLNNNDNLKGDSVK